MRQCVNLVSGQNFVANQPFEATTILGSCVSVIVVHRESRCAGLTHYLLPRLPANLNSSFRYGDCAIDGLIRELLKFSVTTQGMEAMVFGGASVAHISKNAKNASMASELSSSFQVGRLNVFVAKEILSELKIPIVDSHVGGTSARRLIFRVPEFEVSCVTLSEKLSDSEQTLSSNRKIRGQ